MSRRKRVIYEGERTGEAVELFAVPGNFLTRQGRELVKAAREQYDTRHAKRRSIQHLPVEQLRQMLRGLAPDVREAMEDVLVSQEVFTNSDGSEYEVMRADVPPLVAHFAFVALALVEAESEERGGVK